VTRLGYLYLNLVRRSTIQSPPASIPIMYSVWIRSFLAGTSSESTWYRARFAGGPARQARIGTRRTEAHSASFPLVPFSHPFTSFILRHISIRYQGVCKNAPIFTVPAIIITNVSHRITPLVCCVKAKSALGGRKMRKDSIKISPLCIWLRTPLICTFPGVVS
jgi:hypothetical protein